MIVDYAVPGVSKGDISSDVLALAQSHDAVAMDIETTSLDWRSGRIRTIQVGVGGRQFVVDDPRRPTRLLSLLELSSIRKVFHHAPFDLRFIMHRWGVEPRNVACTKIASKIANPEAESQDHSLKSAVRKYLGLDLDKTQQTSNWDTASLTDSQLDYAAADVEHLVSLWEVLEAEVKRLDRQSLLEASLTYLPVRVQLDLLGVGDVFCY